MQAEREENPGGGLSFEREKLALERERLALERERAESERRELEELRASLAPRGAHELTLGVRALLVGAVACLLLGALAGAAIGYGAGVRHSPAPRRVVVSERLLALVSPPAEAEADEAAPPWRASARRRAALVPKTTLALVR